VSSSKDERREESSWKMVEDRAESPKGSQDE
jgi:hypothetical protein